MNKEESAVFEPSFDSSGLIAAIVMDNSDGAVLMAAHMNREALDLTLSTGLVHFWSRSRQRLWKKGETSGEMFAVSEIRVDCDQDVLLIKTTPQGQGNACHTGRRSCFYRRLEGSALIFDTR